MSASSTDWPLPIAGRADRQLDLDLGAVPAQRGERTGRSSSGLRPDEEVHREAGDVGLPVALGDDRDDPLPDQLDAGRRTPGSRRPPG